MDVKTWNQIVVSINKMHRRLAGLEEDHGYIEDHARKRQNQVKDTTTFFVEEIRGIETRLKDLRSTLKDITFEMNKLIDQLKGSVKQEEFERLQERVEAWDPEGLVTKHELARLLQERLE